MGGRGFYLGAEKTQSQKMLAVGATESPDSGACLLGDLPAHENDYRKRYHRQHA